MRTFKKVYVEITNVCNLACPFCPGTARPPAFMPPDRFAAVLSALNGRAGCLYFHLMGEPLLHPELGALLALAGSAGFPVNITTNGRLLGAAEDALLAAPSLRQLNISLQSGVDGGFPGYIDAVIESVNRLRAARSLLISLRLWNLKSAEDSTNKELIARISAGLADGCQKKDSRGLKLAENLWLNEGLLFEWPAMNGRDYGEKGFCLGLRDQIGILCDGTVTPCCLDGEGALKLGNIFSQDLDDILASPRATAIYDGFSRRRVVEELCRRCGYRRQFGI